MQESQFDEVSREDASSLNETWREAEWECVGERRKRAYPGSKHAARREQPEDLAGLALSGGGIRSALFNDGFLQALSHRGLLRYFDFLCSVSGGGYIAGHLTSQSDSNSEKCFHDEEKRAELGRKPETGNIDLSRLAGIGGYLSRPFEFIPAYLWSLVFSLSFYLGVIGIVATLAALLWRSFDNVYFREVYMDVLGLNQFGDELTIAFLPVCFVVSITVLGELLLTIGQFSVADERVSLKNSIKRWQRQFRAVMLLAIVFAILTSIAIYLGNGQSYVGGGSELVYLNNYVQYFAISAGVIQILVFLGRDRLFRSERAEAKGWQRHLQQSITTIVVMFLVFSFVHWMGRENISGYTAHRDPHLVVGDVRTWPRLAAIWADYHGDQIDFQSLSKQPIDSKVLYGLGDELRREDLHLKPAGSWIGWLTRSRLDMFGFDVVGKGDHSIPLPPQNSDLVRTSDQKQSPPQSQAWFLPNRIAGAAYAYWRCAVVGVGESKSTDSPLPKEAHDIGTIASEIDGLIARHLRLREARKNFLTDFNQEFETPNFTAYLLARCGKNESNPSVIEGYIEPLNPPTIVVTAAFRQADKERPIDWIARLKQQSVDTPLKHVSELLSQTKFQLSETQLKNLTTALHSHTLPGVAFNSQDVTPDDPFFDNDWRRPAAPNRLLMEMMYPNTVQRHDIASTWVVPPYDQAARIRWLLGWTMLTLVGLIGGFGSCRVTTVFYFYRKQLSQNFLVPMGKPNDRRGDLPLCDIKPHLDGLPYPLILAAALEPTACNGSYQVSSRPFVFSPLFSGSFENGEVPISSKQLSFSRNPQDDPFTFADAVTLSGAAVTPLMTCNRWLTLILDFFNTGIGQRVFRIDRTETGPAQKSRRPLFSSLLFCSLVLCVSSYFLHLQWSLLIVLPTAILFCICWNLRVGSLGLIRSVFLMKETPREKHFNQNQSFYIADGGYVDYLGVSELLRRHCELIVVSDAGANVGDDSLGTLARMCERASTEQGIRFLDLDHEAPIDFGRLEIDKETRLVHQPFICMRVRYPDAKQREGMLVYCQMSITDADPIEIKNIRNLFPSFPDEPTVNQFYNEKQVAAYRALGYHIGSRLCNELYPWFNNQPSQPTVPKIVQPTAKPKRRSSGTSKRNDQEKAKAFLEQLRDGHSLNVSRESSPGGQPLFEILIDRLLTSYRLACYEEVTYNKDDIFGEAVWASNNFAFPSFKKEISEFKEGCHSRRKFADWWLKRYELNADVRSAYRTAVINDINSLGIENESLCGTLWQTLQDLPHLNAKRNNTCVKELAAHLTCIAVACQEVHRGRPHAAFQVGGRIKLIDLCDRIAEIVFNTAHEQTGYECLSELFEDMDKTIAELIEMERSIFQGGEHVATISFAQCMSNAWGKLARDSADSRKGIDNVIQFTKSSNAFGKNGILTMFEQRGDKQPQSSNTFDLMAAEIRHQLDVGMNKIRLKTIRHGLAKSWYLGFFNQTELQNFQDYQSVPQIGAVKQESTLSQDVAAIETPI